MRKIMSWMLAAIFICGASVLNSCKDAHAQEDNPAPQWCTKSSPFYIEFHSSAPFVPTGYIMTPVEDAAFYSGRNPKSWTIKAKAHPEDDWTTLVTVENDATMPAKTS